MEKLDIATPTEKHIFNCDRPIVDSSQDQLNRTRFSRDLAKIISQWNEKDSLVVAIYGKWGDGKSSVKNLVKNVLIEKRDNDIITMEFSPWQWKGDEHITAAFFQEIVSVLGKTKDSHQQKVASDFLKYAEYLELSNEMVLELRRLIEKTLMALGSGLAIVSGIANEKYKVYLIFAAVVLLVLSFFFEKAVLILKWIGRWKRIAFKDSLNLEDRKINLARSLKKMRSVLVVIIDDIDRLSKEEIRGLFRLIKANADLPNIVYLTFFQRDIVENCLSEPGVYEGSDFLKKIVQVGFDLPKVPNEDIHDILFRDLDILLQRSGQTKAFENGRWSELFSRGLGSYFNNLRDVNRFVSALSFHIGVLKENGSFEINFVDFIGLETLRHFEPKVYNKIFFAKKNLTSRQYLSGKKGSNEERVILDILQSASIGKNEVVKTMLEILFPNVEWREGTVFQSSVGDEEFVRRRVNHPERFGAYFGLYLPEKEISQADLEEALEVSGDERKFYGLLHEYFEQGRLRQFIKKFEPYKQIVDKNYIRAFISALLCAADLVADKNEGMFEVSTTMYIRRIIHWYLLKPEIENVESTYWDVLKSSNAIYLPIDLLFDEYCKREIAKYPDNYHLKDFEPQKILSLFSEKIVALKETDKFKNSLNLPRIVHHWRSVSPDEAMLWLDLYLKDDANFVFFLKRMKSKTFQSSGYESKISNVIQASWLKEFFPNLDRLFERAKIVLDKINDSNGEKKELVEALQIAEDQYRHPEKYKFS